MKVTALLYWGSTHLQNTNRAILSHWNEVIDLQNHTYAFSRQSYLRGIDEEWLNHVLCPHVADLTFTNIDSCGIIARCVAITKFSYQTNWVDASILSQCVRNDFKSLNQVISTIVVARIKREDLRERPDTV